MVMVRFRYPPWQPSNVKGGIKFSNFVKESKQLFLHIPLEKPEVHTAVDSLKTNYTIAGLVLSTYFHSQFFSMYMSERD